VTCCFQALKTVQTASANNRVQQILEKIKTKRSLPSSSDADGTDKVAMLQSRIKQLEDENRRLQTLAMQR
jgi:hypothetical protein